MIEDKLLDDAVTYAKSRYKDTLDQVEINRADIAVINDIFAGRIWADWIRASNSSFNNLTATSASCGNLSASSININGMAVATQAWCNWSFVHAD